MYSQITSTIPSNIHSEAVAYSVFHSLFTFLVYMLGPVDLLTVFLANSHPMNRFTVHCFFIFIYFSSFIRSYRTLEKHCYSIYFYKFIVLSTLLAASVLHTFVRFIAIFFSWSDSFFLFFFGLLTSALFGQLLKRVHSNAYTCNNSLKFMVTDEKISFSIFIHIYFFSPSRFCVHLFRVKLLL